MTECRTYLAIAAALQRKLAQDAVVDNGFDVVTLDCRCDVEATEDGLELEGVVLEQGGDKCSERRFDRGKLGRKGKHPGWRRLALLA